jgi:hypothetical protein
LPRICITSASPAPSSRPSPRSAMSRSLIAALISLSVDSRSASFSFIADFIASAMRPRRSIDHPLGRFKTLTILRAGSHCNP